MQRFVKLDALLMNLWFNKNMQFLIQTFHLSALFEVKVLTKIIN